jgi:hypothetical protein
MPISQDRMLAVLAAAADYAQGLAQARELVRVELTRAQSGQISPLEALEHLEILVTPAGLLNSPLGSAQVLAVEQEHFRKSAGRNAREAARLRRVRGNQPGPKVLAAAASQAGKGILTVNSGPRGAEPLTSSWHSDLDAEIEALAAGLPEALGGSAPAGAAPAGLLDAEDGSAAPPEPDLEDPDWVRVEPQAAEPPGLDVDEEDMFAAESDHQDREVEAAMLEQEAQAKP